MWGGGIVKLTKSEWKPWPIDLLFQHLRRQQQAAEKAAQAAEKARQRQLEEAIPMRHTESATGEGLRCVGAAERTDA